MSCDQVKKFLKEKENSKEQEKGKEKDLNQLRSKVLNYYNLGEKVFYKEGDNIEDFPFTLWDCGFSKRYKYVCDISDEDFEKVLEIYNQEVGTKANSNNESNIDDRAEKILGNYALYLLIFGIIWLFGSLIFAIIVAIDEEDWSLFVSEFGKGLCVFGVSLVGFAFIKVFVNISYKLDKIANLLTKSEK